MTASILCERHDSVATVTINRPERRNAMDRSSWQSLADIFDDLSRDTGLRCVIVTGAGGKAFGSGNDISEFETDRSNARQAKQYGILMHGTIQALKSMPHPTVAMIHGICVGGGLEIAGLCNIRICGESSRFGAPIAKLGLVMAYQEIGALKELVGPGRALEILLEGRIMGSAEAERMGIVSRVVPDVQVTEEAMATAQRIAAGAPLVHRWHKKFLDRLADPVPLTDAELDEGFDCYDTDDFRVGYQAFLDKRKPKFTGR